MVPVAFVVTVCTEAALLVFHISVAIVVARNICYKVVPFTAAFYKIYLLQSYFDCFDYVMVSILREPHPRFSTRWRRPSPAVLSPVLLTRCLLVVPF